MARIGFLLTLFLLSGISTSSAQSVPNQIQTLATLDDLLAVGWKRNPDNMASAIKIYRELKAAGDNDLYLQHAMTLVAIRQQRYPEAKQLIRAAIEKYPTELNLRYTELWLLSSTKDYETALEIVMNLSSDFKDPKQAQALTPFAGFCGQVIGYWQGPQSSHLPKTLPAARLNALEATILKQWPPVLAQAFVSQRKATLEKYQHTKTELGTKRGEETVAQDQERANNLALNKREHAEVQKQLTDLKAKADTLKADYEVVRADLTIQLQTAQNQYNQLQGQYNASLAQALNLRADAKSYRAQDKDPKNKTPNLDNKARDADRKASQLETACRQIGQQAGLIRTQGVRLANDLKNRTASFQSEYKKLDNEYRNLELKEKKLDLEGKDLEKPATGLNSEIRKELDKLDNLDSYVPYSIDEMKATLLKAAAK